METEKKIQAGEVYKLKAVRESDFGIFLDAQTGNTSDDILLHKAQQLRPIKVGDEVEVYIYLDPRRRLTASMKLPKMRLGDIGRVQIINKSKDGAFVDVGTERGVFMPFSHMYGRVNVGQWVWVKLYRDKSGRQAVTMKVEEDFKAQAVPLTDVKKGDQISGYVYNMLDEGYLLVTDNKNILYLHKEESDGRQINYGDQITGRIAFLREDGRANISLKALKQDAMHEDAKRLLEFMQSRKGSMPYSDDTSAEIIKEKFGISKGAFKRALGNLLKSGLVKQEDGWTIIIGQDNQE